MTDRRMMGIHALVALAFTALVGCDGVLGTCWVECRTDSGGLNTHGPYENYTRTECEDAAEVDTTIFQTCVADWEAY